MKKHRKRIVARRRILDHAPARRVRQRMTAWLDQQELDDDETADLERHGELISRPSFTSAELLRYAHSELMPLLDTERFQSVIQPFRMFADQETQEKLRPLLQALKTITAAELEAERLLHSMVGDALGQEG